MIRRLVKSGYAAAVHGTRTGTLLGTAPDRRQGPFVVGYHRVVEDARLAGFPSLPAMLIGLKTLERQLDALARRFEMVDLDEVGERIAGYRVASRPAAAVTFDDAYRDVYELALPLLARKGIPAAIFVVTDRAGTDEMLLHDRLYLLLVRLRDERGAGTAPIVAALREAGTSSPALVHRLTQDPRPVAATETLLDALDQAAHTRLVAVLERRVGPLLPSEDHALMSWEEIGAAAARGFTIGSHTRTHVLCAVESPSSVVRELLGSRLTLERRLGLKVHHVAYPGGSYDETAVRIAAASGYRYGYAICAHGDRAVPQLAIPRRVFWENTTCGAFGAFSPALLYCQAHDVRGFGVRCLGHVRRREAPEPAPATVPAAARRAAP